MARPKWEPSATEKLLARRMVKAGISYELIAQCLGVCREVLSDRLGQELDRLKIERNLEIAEGLFEHAKKNPIVAIFLAKTQLGWRETDNAVKDRPINLTIVSGERPARLRDDAANSE